MAMVKQYDKRSDITYAYEAAYHWDKDKKQSRCTRKLIGRVDDKTGDIIPTDGRCREDKTAKPKKPSKRGAVPAASARYMYYGATYLLEDLDILGFSKTKFVMDRGFYSEDNINGLYKEHIKFLVGTKLSLKFIRRHLDEIYDDVRMFVNYDEGMNTYGYTVTADWDYTQERPYKGDVIKDKRRIYSHYYYSIDKGAGDEQAFAQRIAGLYRELAGGNYVESQKKAYDQFFEVSTTPKRSRLLVSSEKGLDGKIFVEFIALILISHLDHKISINKFKYMRLSE